MGLRCLNTLVLLVVGCLVGSVASAEAARICKRSDVRGDWMVHFSLVNLDGFHAGACAMRVKSSGRILSGGECVTQHERVPIVGGTIRVDRSCVVTGVIEMPGHLVLGDIWSSSLNRSKDTLAGVLLQLDGEGTFTAMRHRNLSARANVARAEGDTTRAPALLVDSLPAAFETPTGGTTMAGAAR